MLLLTLKDMLKQMLQALDETNKKTLLEIEKEEPYPRDLFILS